MPVAACELIQFRKDAMLPQLPDKMVDLGLRGAPNFELLQLIRPDLILTSPFYTRYMDRLNALAPVLSLPFYIPQEAPLPKALDALGLMAQAVDDPQAGTVARARAEAELDDHAARLAGFGDRPVCLVNIGDSRHMRMFGFDSLFGSALTRIGLSNGWDEVTRFSFLAPVPIERLAAMPEARLVIVGRIPLAARRGLQRSILWRSLPQVAENRVYQLPDMNAFGGVPAALGFTGQLVKAFQKGPVAHL